jgi:hypothetical protein
MKLTLVSVMYRGRRFSRFVQAQTINGKAVVSQSVIKSILSEIGVGRGQTISIS